MLILIIINYLRIEYTVVSSRISASPAVHKASSPYTLAHTCGCGQWAESINYIITFERFVSSS